MKLFQIGLLLMMLSFQACAQNSGAPKSETITFIELGSVRCIPCQKMQGVIKQVEEKYPNQVKTIFYDVWTKEGKPYAEQYKIDLIPTQIFLDKDGKEFFRHEGFFPFEDLEKVLLQKIKKHHS